MSWTTQIPRNLKNSSSYLWDCEHVARKTDATVPFQSYPQPFFFPCCYYFSSVCLYLTTDPVCMLLCTRGYTEVSTGWMDVWMHRGHWPQMEMTCVAFSRGLWSFIFSWCGLSTGLHKIVTLANLNSYHLLESGSVQFSSVAQSCPTLCNPRNRSTPGLSVHHQLLEFIQTQVHWVDDAIQPSHPP